MTSTGVLVTPAADGSGPGPRTGAAGATSRLGTPLGLGARRSVDGRTDLGAFQLDADNLTTHGVIVGMTGSGKTGLVTVLIEEALASEIPVLVIDVKGDLPNLLLAVPSFAPEALAPWVE